MKREHLIPKVLCVIVCFCLLTWMVWKAGPGQLWQTLCQLPIAIGLSCLVWGVGYLLNAVSFRQVIRGVALPASPVLKYGEVLRLTVAGYVLNYITPFGLLGGEPYRIWALRSRMGGERSTWAVVYYSMMHVASHFSLWLVASVSLLLCFPNVKWCEEACVWLLIAVCLAAFWMFGRLFSRGMAPRFLRRWVKWPLLPPTSIVSPWVRASFGMELLSRLVNVAEYWILMQALGYTDFGYVEALWVVAFSSLLANVLFFVPLQMGMREAGILFALEYLLPGDLFVAALTLSLATRIREFIWISVGLMTAVRFPANTPNTDKKTK